jgi:anti-sigma regulatory factor (Ser/Thr protein kinase)
MRKPLDEKISREIAMPARPESVSPLRDFVCSHLRDMAFEEKRVEQVSLALAEAIDNILRFACSKGNEEIKIVCDPHEMGALLVNIIDTGEPFNMLVLSTFPEVAAESSKGEAIPSTKVMKRAIRDVEYRRDGASRTNILAWVVSK